MGTSSDHLTQLEHELETDLAEAQRLIELGHIEAMATLESGRDELGKYRRCAGRKIDRYAHCASEDLKLVRQRLLELHLLLSREQLKDLDIFDHFRDRVVEAMEFAEDDLGELKHRGDAWSSSHVNVSAAWSQLARRLSLVRMHLVQEVETALKDFGAERDEIVRPAAARRVRPKGMFPPLLPAGVPDLTEEE
jgi:hypothetical protein